MATTDTLNKQLKVKLIENFPFPADKPEINILNAIKFVPRDSDVIILSYPKCSSSWINHCLWKLIRRRPIVSFVALAPDLDNCNMNSLDTTGNPRVIRSSLPYRLTNVNPNAKYIYITRHPKDVLMSLYFLAYKAKEREITRQSFFQDFTRGHLPYGDYFHHASEWYRNRNENIFFLNYESMYIKPKAAILALAKFLGPLYHIGLTESVINQILEYPYYDYLSFTVQENDEQDIVAKQISVIEQFDASGRKPPPYDCSSYIGISLGHLNDVQSQYIDWKIAEKFGDGALGMFGVKL